MTPLNRQIRRFRTQEDGLVMTEFLVALPLLIWVFMALFVYWDTFRTMNQAQKAAYSIADLVSRQSEVSDTFINGMQSVTNYLMDDSPNVKLRISSIKYDELTQKHTVIFSRSPGNKLPALTDASLVGLKSKIPLMADRDSVIIVETSIAYAPAFEVGIQAQNFDDFVVTRPRYYLQVCLKSNPCPNAL